MIEHLYSMKGYQILKSDKVFQSVLDKRIRRFEVWKTKITASKLRKEISKCIVKTREVHQIAEELRKARNKLFESFPVFMDVSQALDRLISLEDVEMANDRELKKWIKYKEMQTAMAMKNEAKFKAREIYLEALEGKVKDDISLLELIQRRAKDQDPVMLRQVKVEVLLMHSGFQVLEGTLSSCPHIVSLIDLHRGVFYMGIVNIEGGKIDQKTQQDHLIRIAENAVGFVNVVGNVFGAIQIIKETNQAVQTFRGVDLPDIVNSAQFMEIFMTNYLEALSWWKATAEIYTLATTNTAKYLKSYKI